MRTRAHAADTAALDVAFLASTFDIPEDTIQALINGPTVELVNSFLSTLTSQGQEYETLKADKLKLDVELENTVRTSEAKVKAQKAAVAKSAKEVEELRTKLNEADTARETLSSELEQLRSSNSGSTAETIALRQRVETLESSNRETLALVENKSSEKDRVSVELSEQHSKLLVVRREVSQLEERNQALENAVSSHKFKEQSLQQEIDLLKRNNEWHSNELQTRGQEHANFRKERNARIASLQRDLEDSVGSVDTLRRSESTLKQRLEEVQAKADEAFAKIAGLEEDFSRKEHGWKAELDGSKRLADLQAQSAATHKARLQEVQAQVDQTNDDAAAEIGRLQAEIETERSYKDQAESKLAELELMAESRGRQPPPASPAHNGASNPATPGRSGSPFVVPGSARKYANGLPFSTTQAQAKWYEMEEELAAERRRTAKLSQAMDEMIQEIENRGPELVELKGEQDRLEEEVLTFSRMLDEANSTRDGAIRDAQRLQAQSHAKEHEASILRQQLRDLSAQIKILLVEIQSREEGLGEMSAQERVELERAARGELEDWSQNETFTNQIIAQRLVIFRNVEELENKNAEQLKILHELGDKLEGDEAREKAQASEAFAAENEQMKQQISRYKDELRAMNTTIESYAKERDMFRRMLQHRGQLSADTDVQAMFGQSIPPATPQQQQRNELQQVPQTPRSKDVEDLNQLLKQQQTYFDQFRNEAVTDRKSLQDQVDGLSRDKGSLQAEIAHWKSQKTLADERQSMLQSNFAALRNENTELQKRSQQMSENAARQDLRTQQVAEDLVEARSATDVLRNENAKARAEKELWTRIETRLTEDNKGLMDERSRLNKLVADLQNLQNEREMSDSETRRKLQGRVEGLESELAECKKKLDHEVEESRKATLRREYEENQSRTRVDDLVKSLGNVREELASAKTTRDQLQARVDETKIELRSAEERVAALQPRPTPRAGADVNGEQQANDEENDLTTEQRLALETSELRRDLELAKNEVESARQQVEQYKAIAQSTEEELANFNETSEQYKEENDRLIVEKESRLNELEQKMEDLTNELSTTNKELSELRSTAEDSTRALNEQKANYEAELTRLKDDADRYAEEKKLYQADLKAQAEIAQQAQQSYEDELLKHAEAAKTVQSVRKEYNDLRIEVAGIRAEADAAKASLERGEESWAEQSERFEKELEEAKRRREDVDQQNKILHQQMEGFSSELAALRSGKTVPSVATEDSAGTPMGESNWQEVIKYLRREKDIVDVQYDLAIQESKRLQQQLDYANAQLEESRQKLAEERRQATEKSASESSTSKLMQTINELNLLRESNTTLRNEAHQSRERLKEKSAEVERMLTEMEPLTGRIGEMEGELESKDGEMKLLQNDRDHWRERTQNIISKYDRTDPAELEELKKKIEELTVEKEQLAAEQTPLREQLERAEQQRNEAVEEATKSMNTRLESYRNQAKEQNRRQVARIKEFEQAQSDLKSQKETAEGELTVVKAELETLKTELESSKKVVADGQTEESSTQGTVQEAPQQTDEISDNSRVAAAEARAAELAAHEESLKNEIQRLNSRVQELEGQITALQSQLDMALQGEDGEVRSESGENASTLDRLKQDLATAQQEVETLRANAVSSSSESQPAALAQPAKGEKSVADQIAEEVAKLRSQLEEQHTVAKKQMEEESHRRIDGMKNQLKDKLKAELERNTSARQQLMEQHSAEIQKIKDDHEAAISRLKEDHAAEMQRLSEEGSKAAGQSSVPSGVKKESTEGGETQPEITGEKMIEMIKTDQRLKNMFNNNLTKRVASQTEKLNQAISEKDQEIARINAALAAKEAEPSTASADDNKDEKEELLKKLELAEQEKQAAVRSALETAEKKVKVQLSQRDIVQAKLSVVRRAAQETPERAVKEVWEMADKARPVPKPAGSGAAAASPASPAVAKPSVPSSPTQAPQPEATAAQNKDQNKIQQRQERFGTVPAPGTFGLPKNPFAASQSGPVAGSFGQPSKAPQPSAQPGSSLPNPQAATFNPQASQSDAGTGPGTVKGPTGIPRGGGGSGIPRGGARGGAQNVPVQAAPVIGQPNTAQRGGAQSGIGRGGNAGGRGGRGGTQRGGGGTNAGQKRQHDGEHQGDEKRMRGGHQGGGAA